MLVVVATAVLVHYGQVKVIWFWFVVVVREIERARKRDARATN